MNLKKRIWRAIVRGGDWLVAGRHARARRRAFLQRAIDEPAKVTGLPCACCIDEARNEITLAARGCVEM